jgi:hypothetical protein
LRVAPVPARCRAVIWRSAGRRRRGLPLRGAQCGGDPMLNNAADPNPVEPAVRHRREVLTFWAFFAFLLAGAVVIGIDALMSYA